MKKESVVQRKVTDAEIKKFATLHQQALDLNPDPLTLLYHSNPEIDRLSSFAVAAKSRLQEAFKNNDFCARVVVRSLYDLHHKDNDSYELPEVNLEAFLHSPVYPYMLVYIGSYAPFHPHDRLFHGEEAVLKKSPFREWEQHLTYADLYWGTVSFLKVPITEPNGQI